MTREVVKRKPKKKFEELRKSKYVKKWMEATKEAQQCKKLSTLTRFIEFTGKDADKLILEHYNDMKQDNPLEIRNIAKKQIHKFYYRLIDETKFRLNPKGIKIRDYVSMDTAFQYCYSVLPSFYRENNVGLRFQRTEYPAKTENGLKEETWEQDDKMITQKHYKETLKTIRDAMPMLRDRFILHATVSTGLSGVDLFKLKIKDVKVLDEPKIAYISGMRQKTNVPYQVFFNSETCSLMKIYMAERKEKIVDPEGLKLREEITKESWLFISNYWDENDKPKQVASDAFRTAMRKASKKVKMKGITPKSLRDYYATAIKKVKNIPFEITERMLGHKCEIPQRYSTMLRANNWQEFAQYFYENFDSVLCLENGVRMMGKHTEEIRKLQADLVVRDATINTLVNDMESLKGTMEEMKKYFSIIIQDESIDSAKAFEVFRGRKVKENIKPKEFGIFTEKETISKKNLRKK